MNKIMQSYVWHNDKCFFVSTINRESSAREAYELIYAETMVWEYDCTQGERGRLIYQFDDIKNGIKSHIKACQELHANGRINED